MGSSLFASAKLRAHGLFFKKLLPIHLEGGADATIRNNDGETAFSIAKGLGKHKVMEVFETVSNRKPL
jgi:ankyrin repeat protein